MTVQPPTATTWPLELLDPPESISVLRAVIQPLHGELAVGLFAIGPAAVDLLQRLRPPTMRTLALQATPALIDQALDGLDFLILLLDSSQTDELHLAQRLAVMAVASGKLTAVLVPQGAGGPPLCGPAAALNPDPAWLRPWQQTGAWLLPQADAAQLQALIRTLLLLRADRMLVHIDQTDLHEVLGRGHLGIAAVCSTKTDADWALKAVQQLVRQTGLSQEQLRHSPGIILLLRGSPELLQLNDARSVLSALRPCSDESAAIQFGLVFDPMLPQQIELILLVQAGKPANSAQSRTIA